jgi:hypothetical protein
VFRKVVSVLGKMSGSGAVTDHERSAYEHVVTAARHLLEEYTKYNTALAVDNPIYWETRDLANAIDALDKLRERKDQ